MVLADESLNVGPVDVRPYNVGPVRAGPGALLCSATGCQDQRSQNENNRNSPFPGSWSPHHHFMTPRQNLHPLNSPNTAKRKQPAERLLSSSRSQMSTTL